MNRIDFPSAEFVLARAVALRGIGGRRSGELMVVDAAGIVQGSLFGGAIDSEVKERSRSISDRGESFALMTVKIGDKDAVAAGLACGGEADILLNRSSSLPSGFVDRLASREPTALATVVSGPHEGLAMATGTDGSSSIRGKSEEEDAFSETLNERMLQLLVRRLPMSGVEQLENEIVSFEVFSPPTHLLIVGGGELAHAIAVQGGILGWSSHLTDEANEGVLEVGALGSNDALVVLSHDHDTGIPIVAEALRSKPNLYVGGLGSRHTQEARYALLSDLGFSHEELGRIYGPIGLDLGSKSPEETALAICAEILAHVSGRDARSLKYSSGPING